MTVHEVSDLCVVSPNLLITTHLCCRLKTLQGKRTLLVITVKKPVKTTKMKVRVKRTLPAARRKTTKENKSCAPRHTQRNLPRSLPQTTKRASASKTTKAKKKVTITDDVDDFDVTKMLGDMALDRNSPNFCLEIKDPWKRATFIKTASEIQFYDACVVIFLMVVSHIMSGSA